MNRKQCKGCAYFIGHNGTGMKFCHYMLYTGKRRKVGEDEKCLSKSKTKKRVCEPFDVYAPQA
jgi:hypothetical protein